MRGSCLRLRSWVRACGVLLVLGAAPVHAQEIGERPEGAAPPAPHAAPPARSAPAGPRRLPVPMFRPVALPAFRDFPPPPGYIEKVQRNAGLITAGSIVFATTYAVGVGAAAATGFKNQSGWVALPIVGPFIAATQRDFECGTPSTPAAVQACQRETISEAGAVAILAGIGVGHVLGTSLLIAGLLDKQRIWVREDLVAVNVQVGPGAGFFQVSGRF